MRGGASGSTSGILNPLTLPESLADTDSLRADRSLPLAGLSSSVALECGRRATGAARGQRRLLCLSALVHFPPNLLAPKLALTSFCCYLLTRAFFDRGFHDFELPELSLKL